MIQQVGLPMELYQQPVNRFVAGFIGSPAMSIVEGELAVCVQDPGRDGGPDLPAHADESGTADPRRSSPTTSDPTGPS